VSYIDLFSHRRDVSLLLVNLSDTFAKLISKVHSLNPNYTG